MTAIRSIGDRTNNAELIRDAAHLGYISGRVLDMTYGKGRFWTLYRPDNLLTNDIDTRCDTDYWNDFTDLPFSGDKFDTVVFDPPYKLNGTGGSHPSDASYGVDDSVYTRDRMSLILAGLNEAVRVCKPRGHVLVKCQDQVVSGRKFWMTHAVTSHAESLGLRLDDMLHVQSYRPQPEGRSQLHSRGDYSTLLIFQKGAGMNGDEIDIESVLPGINTPQGQMALASLRSSPEVQAAARKVLDGLDDLLDDDCPAGGPHIFEYLTAWEAGPGNDPGGWRCVECGQVPQ